MIENAWPEASGRKLTKLELGKDLEKALWGKDQKDHWVVEAGEQKGGCGW